MTEPLVVAILLVLRETQREREREDGWLCFDLTDVSSLCLD